MYRVYYWLPLLTNNIYSKSQKSPQPIFKGISLKYILISDTSKVPSIGRVYYTFHLMQGSFEPINPASNMFHLPIGLIQICTQCTSKTGLVNSLLPLF